MSVRKRQNETTARHHELNGYKKLIRNPKTRRRILQALSFVPDAIMLRMQYWIKLRRRLNLKNPKRFTEKIQWYKLNWRDPIMHVCVDKYAVRSYVKDKGLGRILVDLYGLYENPEDVTFSCLPNQFVAKKTNGSGGNDVLICRSREAFSESNAYETMRDWMQTDRGRSSGREWAYEGLEPRIIIEHYLENESNPEAGIADYKFFASRGRILGIVVDIDRYVSHKRNFYDANWNWLDVSSDKPSFGDVLEKPAEYNEMCNVVSVLSEDFPFVRVDLYLVNHQIYFGELTFYPWSGYVQFFPDEYDYRLGAAVTLS